MITLPNPVIVPKEIAALGGGGGGGVMPDPSMAATCVDPPPQELPHRPMNNEKNKFRLVNLLMSFDLFGGHVE
jgi:hypothetical protein